MKLYTRLNSKIRITDTSVAFTHVCDVLVVGAGTGGIFAALAASEEGADVILIENDGNIGGMRVRGNVTPYYYGAPGGSFESTDAAAHARTAFAYPKTQPEPLQLALTERIFDSRVRLITKCAPMGVYLEENRVVGVRAISGEGVIDISARMVIDATSDGHLLRQIGVEYRFGRERDGKVAPFTVRTQYIKNGRYVSVNDDSGYINQYDEANFSERIIRAHANAERFLKDGEFLSLPTEAGIREGLAFVGEDTLVSTDLDKHGHDRALDDEVYQTWMTVSNLATVTVNIPVPFGAVVPRGFLGIVTAGRCLSIDTYALGAVRMNRDMYRMGECVGVAASMAVATRADFLDIDYADYRTRVEKRGCYNGYPERTYGFDNNRNLISYKPLEFTPDKTFHLLYTETPGAAIWSAYVADDKEAVRRRLTEMLNTAPSTEARYNCAIALGVTGDHSALPILREIVKKRDWYYYKDCRRSNQHRTAIAVCLIGRLGDESDVPLLSEIVFDEHEIDREMFQGISDEEIAALTATIAKMHTHLVNMKEGEKEE